MPGENRFTQQAVFNDALDHGLLLIGVVRAYPGVALPTGCTEMRDVPGVVALKLSLRMPGLDLCANDPTVLGVTLKFGGTPYRCLIPWSAIAFISIMDPELPSLQWLVDVDAARKAPTVRARPRLALVITPDDTDETT